MNIAEQLRTIEDNVPKVYQAGYDDGAAAGGGGGGDNYYDTFWDTFQDNGERANYQNAFWSWDGSICNPKYGIQGTLTNAFQTSTVTAINVPIISGSNSCQNAFYKCNDLVSIASLNITGATNIYNMFYSCYALEEIRFEGTIGLSIGFPHSNNLSTESVQSIIDHLKDLTGATAQTLTFHADVGNKLTQAQKDAISAKNWTLAY